MKDQYQNRLLKKIVTGLLTLMLIVGAVCIADVTGSHTLAADSVEDATPQGVDYLVEKHTNISDYRIKNALAAPKLSLSGVTGEWLFAGWYTDSDCKSALQSTVVRETSAPMSDGTYYAKYVPADLLTVKCQVSSNTTENSESTVLRCVSSVDTLKYNKIGFDLMTPNGTENMESRKVGTRIKATTEEDAYSYSPKVVDTESEYFFSATYKVVKSDTEDFDTKYFVKPYWITKDGTKVYGAGRYVTVNEGVMTSTIYLPVKLDAEPTENATFTADGATAVDLISYDTDSGYAHFALTVADRTKLKSVTKFEIKDSSASVVGTSLYRNLLTKYTGPGSGTEDTSWYTCYSSEDEFVIATSADLYGLAANVTIDTNKFLGKEVYVVSDIVINKGTAEETGWNKNKADGVDITDGTDIKWIPINNFAGTFDGQGHSISGIYSTKAGKWSGFFQATTKDTVVENLRLVNSYFECTATGQAWLGSIAGYAEGTFRSIYSDAIVSSVASLTGGLLGAHSTDDNLKIFNCWFDGKVIQKTSTAFANGGILGYVDKGDTQIEQCLNTGTIQGGTQSGGVCGRVTGYAAVTIEDSLNTGKITGSNPLGAISTNDLSGNVKIDILNTYWTDESCANVTWDTGTVGKITKDTYEYYENNLKGIVDQASIKLDFTNYWAMQYDSVPILRTFVEQSKQNNVDISWYDANAEEMKLDSVADLMGFNYIANSKAVTFKNKTIKLETDIALSNTEESNWTPIALFEGTFDGQGHSISGVTISGEGAQGFFSKALDCTIKNFSLTRSSVYSTKLSCGSIAAQFTGTMENVYSDADITLTTGAYAYMGGLVGVIQSASAPSSTAPSQNIIRNCWYAGTITTDARYVGGIVGTVDQQDYTELTIDNCLVTGTLTSSLDGKNSMGGFCGCVKQSGNKLTIEDSMFAGKISSTGTDPIMIGALVGEAQQGTITFNNAYSVAIDYAESVEDGVTDEVVKGIGQRRSALTVNGTAEIFDDAASLKGETVKVSTKLDFSTPVWVTREGDFPILNVFEK